mgnify:CR=1 FL=1
MRRGYKTPLRHCDVPQSHMGEQGGLREELEGFDDEYPVVEAEFGDATGSKGDALVP